MSGLSHLELFLSQSWRLSPQPDHLIGRGVLSMWRGLFHTLLHQLWAKEKRIQVEDVPSPSITRILEIHHRPQSGKAFNHANHNYCEQGTQRSQARSSSSSSQEASSSPPPSPDSAKLTPSLNAGPSIFSPVSLPVRQLTVPIHSGGPTQPSSFAR